MRKTHIEKRPVSCRKTPGHLQENAGTFHGKRPDIWFKTPKHYFSGQKTARFPPECLPIPNKFTLPKRQPYNVFHSNKTKIHPKLTHTDSRPSIHTSFRIFKKRSPCVSWNDTPSLVQTGDSHATRFDILIFVFLSTAHIIKSRFPSALHPLRKNTS